jgi:predicted HicB family RNase H-like nuclease
MVEYKGYTGVFEYDPEIEMLSGYVVDLRDQIHFEGLSVAEVRASMVRAIDHYLGVCRNRGEEPDRPFSGRFNARLGSPLHRQIAIDAAAQHESMNDWLVQAAERRLGEAW